MPKFRDLAGQKFQMLTVVSRRSANKGKKIQWNCVCDCGKSAIVGGRHLVSGAQKSCGCLHFIHDMSKSPEFRTWMAMITRCYSVNAGNYARYGGKGISVCARWRHDFKNFYADMGPHPGKGYSLDRINGGGNYEPINCRWATASQQVRNRSVTLLTEESARNIRSKYASGSRVVDLAKAHGVAVSTVYKTLSGNIWANL